MSKSILLDTVAWDWVLDASANIAVCTEPYSLAQDVACALRTFLGEVYYDTSLGVPYYQSILNMQNPYSVVESILVQQALTMSGVVEAKCLIIEVIGRKVSGQIQVTDRNGAISNASF